MPKSNWNFDAWRVLHLYWGVTTAMVTGARNDQGIAERDAVDHGIFWAPGFIRRWSIFAARDRTARSRTCICRARAAKWCAHAREEAPIAKAYLAGGADFLGTADGNGPPELFAAFADEAQPPPKPARRW